MSKILALDTSTDACSVALNCDGEVVESFCHIPREHTQRLLPMVDEMLAQHQMGLRDMDAIAFGCGPGSFTGLRICLSTVQGLAFGADLPVIPVSTLQTLANSAFRLLPIKDDEQLLLAALDARMKQIYWGAFTVKRKQVLRLTNEYVSAPEELFKHPALANINRGVIGIGPGWAYKEMGQLSAREVFLDCQPHAYDTAVIGAADFDKGEAISVLDAQPTYLRDEISWKKHIRKR